jgi:hypothetical protein
MQEQEQQPRYDFANDTEWPAQTLEEYAGQVSEKQKLPHGTTRAEILRREATHIEFELEQRKKTLVDMTTLVDAA